MSGRGTSRSPRQIPPHPPLGHLLPGGEKGSARAAESWGRRCGESRSPSPRRGEGWGEGVLAVMIAEILESNAVSLSALRALGFTLAHQAPARQGDGLLAGRGRLDELAVQLRTAGTQVAPAGRLCQGLCREQADDDVVAERVALNEHIAVRVENHREARLDCVVVNADRVAEDGEHAIFPGSGR